MIVHSLRIILAAFLLFFIFSALEVWEKKSYFYFKMVLAMTNLHILRNTCGPATVDYIALYVTVTFQLVPI